MSAGVIGAAFTAPLVLGSLLEKGNKTGIIRMEGIRDAVFFGPNFSKAKIRGNYFGNNQ